MAVVDSINESILAPGLGLVVGTTGDGSRSAHGLFLYSRGGVLVVVIDKFVLPGVQLG